MPRSWRNVNKGFVRPNIAIVPLPEYEADFLAILQWPEESNFRHGTAYPWID